MLCEWWILIINNGGFCFKRPITKPDEFSLVLPLSMPTLHFANANEVHGGNQTYRNYLCVYEFNYSSYQKNLAYVAEACMSIRVYEITRKLSVPQLIVIIFDFIFEFYVLWCHALR